MKLPITLVIITLNEEAKLASCIDSVPWADEVIVLDSGSLDRTKEIAESMGARFVFEKWRGFGAQKAFGVSLAKNDWIVSLDADEALSPELAQEIAQRFSALKPEFGYEMPRRSFYLGRWILHGGWYPDRQLRLFHRKHSAWLEVPIHEHVESQQVERLQHPIDHFVFVNFFEQIQTNNRYSSLQAEQHFKKGQKFSYLRLIFKPYSKFIECYFLKLGFLDGLPGFLIAVSAAYSVFIRWGKVWELEQASRRGEQWSRPS